MKEKSGNTIQVNMTENTRHFCRLVILSRFNPEGLVHESDKRKMKRALVEVFAILYPLWESEGTMEPLEDITYNLLSKIPEESYFSQEEIDEFLSRWDDRNSRVKIIKNMFARILAMEDQRVANENDKDEGI